MSRVTPPVTKFTHAIRSISSSAQASRSSVLLESHARHAQYLPQRHAALKAECSSRQLKTTGKKAELVDRLTAHDMTREHSTLGARRPSPATNPLYRRTGSLIQGFRTSAPKAAVHDSSTIDFFYFPDLSAESHEDPFSKVRVPLLPDNYSLDRASHAAESLDEAVPRPEIMIVAAHPEAVVAVAMTEVVGNEGVEGTLEDLTRVFVKQVETLKEPGVVSELWEGFMDDLFGAKKVATH